MCRRLCAAAFVLMLTLGQGAWAQEGVGSEQTTDQTKSEEVAELPPTPGEFDKADMAWMMVSSALVLMMTAPGLFLFYGGLVRKKNVLSVIVQCLFLCGMNTVLWIVIGYSIAFGSGGPTMYTHTDAEGNKHELTWIGGVDEFMVNGVTPYLTEDGTQIYPYAEGSTIPELLFMVFQMMFFIITPALICGAFAERMKFSAMVLFTGLWGLIVYCPLAHWVWAADVAFLGPKGPFPGLDFAGGLVVHASSGISALICALFLGKRLEYGKEPIVPHNMTYAAIGAAMLWVGWFGFNAGSALQASTSAVNAFVVTHVAAATALVAWTVAEWLVVGKPSALGACSGLVAGLVAITPASGFVDVSGALALGAISGVVCFLSCAKLKPLLGYDDSLDAFGVHGVGGITGAILTGVFATEAIMGAGAIEDRTGLIFNQVFGVLVTAAWAILGSVVILTLIKVTVGLRVTEKEEIEGLDVTQHGESGYMLN